MLRYRKDSRMADEPDARDHELERQQPLGGINPKVLLGIGAVLVIAAIVILVIVLTKT